MITDNYYSFGSIIFYYIIGLGCASWIRLTISEYYYYDKKIMFGLLCFMLSVVAALRYVSYGGIGGMDASTYEYMFLNPNSERLTRLEEIFVFYTQFMATITSSPIIYRFFSYGIITMGYGIFLYNFCRSKKISVIPFILIIFIYLRSFNTMRTSMAIAVFTIGLVLLYKKRTYLAMVLIISTVFIHRMSILYVCFLPFYYMYKNYNFNTNKRIFIFLIIYASLGYFLALKVQSYVLLFMSLSENDVFYLTRSLNYSIFSKIPLIFQHVLMLIALTFWNNKLPKTSSVHFLRLLVIFDIIIIPVSVIFGMWRALEYLYIPRLVMWSYLIPTIAKCYKKEYNLLINSSFFIIFSFWLLFRINQEWQPAGLLPYKLIFLG